MQRQEVCSGAAGSLAARYKERVARRSSQRRRRRSTGMVSGSTREQGTDAELQAELRTGVIEPPPERTCG